MAKNNTVSELKNIHFSALALEQKVEIKNIGRPTPSLQMTGQQGKSKGYNYTRKFDEKVYKENSWICGCELTNKLFCFPCILFGGDKAWTEKGQNDLKHLSERINKHKSSKQHLNNCTNLNFLGRGPGVRCLLSSAYHNKIKAENIQIKKNRAILSKIIDCVKFCAFYELGLRGHNETEDSTNSGIFLGLIDFAKDLDNELKVHLENATVFKGTSKTIQNELLQCMLEVCREEILQEVGDADYLAILGDETTDVSNYVQFVLVLRTVDKVGNVVERFWGFFNPAGQDAESIAAAIEKELNIIIPNNPEKLICQGYDGANVMSGNITGVQARIREKYKNAYYIHCEAHQLNLIMKRATFPIEKSRKFFSSLNQIAAFFTRSPARNAVLDKYMEKRARVPVPCIARWNSNSRTANMIHTNRIAIKKCVKHLSKIEKKDDVLQKMMNIYHTLKDKHFIYWLQFFQEVLPHVDLLYSALQKSQTDAIQVKKNTEDFVNAIKLIRDEKAEKLQCTRRAAQQAREQRTRNSRISSDSSSSDSSSSSGSSDSSSDSEMGEPPAKRTRRRGKRRRQNGDINTSCSKLLLCIEVCDIIIKEATERFEFCDHLEASMLLNKEKFIEFNKNFPEREFNITTQIFPQLDYQLLRSELEILYSREEMRDCDGAIPLLKLIIYDNIQEFFCETFKLLKIIVTMPMTTVEAERCFSTLKRIKDYLRNTMGEDRLNALAMLSTEKNFIENISNFNDRVIDKFAKQKNRRMDFCFKEVGQM